MKTFLFFILLQLSLPSLWKEYDAQKNLDRPRKQLEILEKIIARSSSEKAPVDYYRACSERCSVRCSVSWKERGVAMAEFDAAVSAYGLPVMEFHHLFRQHDRQDAWEYFCEHEKELALSNVKGFHDEVFSGGDGLRRFIGELVRDDREFALWTFSLDAPYLDKGQYRCLFDTVKGRYPDQAVAEYLKSSRLPQDVRRTDLLDGERRYEGMAAALLFRCRRLGDEYSALVSGRGSTSEQYLDLYERCRTFEKERKSFSGQEASLASCCNAVEGLVETLESRKVSCSVGDGVLSVIFRNCARTRVEIVPKDGKAPVWSAAVVNGTGSFYVYDTVNVALPALDDGDYVVRFSSDAGHVSQDYFKRTLSVYSRPDALGHAVYVADYMSGKPLDRVDIHLYDSSDRIQASAENVSLNGFTPLPGSMEAMLSRKGSYVIFESVGDDGVRRRSDRIYLHESGRQAMTDESIQAAVMLDRAAFTPGETLRFKVVAGRFRADARQPLAGENLSVTLLDVQRNEVSRIRLKTGELGSCAGSFAIPSDCRNGCFAIVVSHDGRECGRKYFIVDEFVLPSFTVEFEDSGILYLEGDEICVRGKVRSCSGHALSSARVYGGIVRGHMLEDDEEALSLSSDGSFELKCLSTDSGSYRALVKVVDITGETLEFESEERVYDRIPFYASLANADQASRENVLSKDVAEVSVNWRWDGDWKWRWTTGANSPISIDYVLRCGDKILRRGSGAPGGFTVDMAGLQSGAYVLEMTASMKNASGQDVQETERMEIYRISDSDTVFRSEEESLFRVIEDGGVSLQLAAGRGPLWACVEIGGRKGEVLFTDLVYIDGGCGREGSVRTLSYGFPEEWGDEVQLNVLYFKDGKSRQYSHEYARKVISSGLPLKISRFREALAPSSEYALTIGTVPHAECAVSIFDKSTETILPNSWGRFRGVSIIPVSYSDRNGHDRSIGAYPRPYFKSRAALAFDSVCYEEAESDMLELESAPVCATYEIDDMTRLMWAAEDRALRIRENFATTLAFEPFLRSDGDGNVEFRFFTSDRLSTFVVNAYAHDKSMRDGLAREEFMVSIPVQLSVAAPQLLRQGDRYVLKAGLSGTSAKDVDGRISMYIYTCSDWRNANPVACAAKPVHLDPSGSAGVEFEIDVPSARVLGIKLVFMGKCGETDISDAMFVSVPVDKATQTLREAHSCLVLDGMDRDGLLSGLRSSFVNMPASETSLREIRIIDMIREAIPERFTPAHDDAVTVSSALYAARLASSLDSCRSCGTEVCDSLVARILACRNADGGFGWYEGMNSSPAITSLILERAAALSRRGLDMGISSSALADAVAFLDRAQFGDPDRPLWCGGLSVEEYACVRSMYANVHFKARTGHEFRKRLRDYLVPKGGRSLEGNVFAKAQRARTLLNLSSSEGNALARDLGIRLRAGSRISSSLEADLASLREYAVPHASGGEYFPNAFMPWRGIFSGELYVHAFLCDLLRDLGEDELADSVRLWIMVQKETQKWNSDPAVVDALASVLDASDRVKSASVLVLSAERELPYGDVGACGNGLSVSLKYYRKDGSEIREGDMLGVGDAVTSVCTVWSGENRSFVHVSVPRPACLRPVQQLSGHIGWWMRPLSVRGACSFTPQGYRNVSAGMTEYFFDAFPEENTSISEGFFVTQAGAFTAPVAVAESLYAPHYVANAAFGGVMTSE